MYHTQINAITLFVLMSAVQMDSAATGQVTEFVSSRRRNGTRTITAHVGGVSAVDSASGELLQSHGNQPILIEASFIFREVTDGEEVIQVIYDGDYTPKNCRVSTDQDTIKELLSRVEHEGRLVRTSSGHLESSAPLVVRSLTPICDITSLLPFVHYSYNASDHNFVRVKPGCVEVDLPEPMASLTDLGSMKSKCAQLHQTPPAVTTRHRRSSMLMYPNTLWCGKGTEARSYDELGEEAAADACCRDHDTCPYLQINPLEEKLFLWNVAPYTLSDCKCDKAFHKCLKRAGTPVSLDVGNMFFNRMKIKCFVTRKKLRCMERTFLGGCQRSERIDTAVIRNALPFPEGKNKTKEEKQLQKQRPKRGFIFS